MTMLLHSDPTFKMGSVEHLSWLLLLLCVHMNFLSQPDIFVYYSLSVLRFSISSVVLMILCQMELTTTICGNQN